MPWVSEQAFDALSVLEERQLHMERELTVFLPKTLLRDSIYQLVVTAQHQQSDDAQSHGDAQRVRTDRGIRRSKGKPMLYVMTRFDQKKQLGQMEIAVGEHFCIDSPCYILWSVVLSTLEEEREMLDKQAEKRWSWWTLNDSHSRDRDT